MPKILPTLLIYIIVVVSFLFLFSFPSIANVQIVINEVFPNPVGEERGNEWVELYNTVGSEVSLEGCTLYFHDSTDTTQKITFGVSDKFAPEEYFKQLFTNGAWLRNDGDKIMLDCPFGQDSISYGDKGGVNKPDEGRSIGRSPDGNNNIYILASVTPAGPNSSPEPTPTPAVLPTSTPTSTPAPTPTPTKTPTPTPTKTPTPKPTATPKSEVEGISDNSGGGGDILALRNQLANEEASPSGDEEDSKKKFPFFPVVLIIFGAGLMGFAGYTLFKKMKSEGYNSESEENI